MWRFSDNSSKTIDIQMLDIKILMKQKCEKINELRNLIMNELKEINNFQLKDNFFLLKYILSYRSDVDKAAESIRKSLSWRKNNSEFVKKAMNSDLSTETIHFPEHMKPYLRAIRKYLAASGHKNTKNGQPLVICRIEACNFIALGQLIPPEIIQDYILFTNEVEYWECDRLSRNSGKLHKAYRIVDLKNLSIKSLDRTFLRSFTSSSNVAEFLHPQLVGKTIFVNPPAALKITLEILKMLGISRRALEKIYSCKSLSSQSKASPEVANIIEYEDLPKFLGGICEDDFFSISKEGTSDSTSENLSNEIKNELELIKSYKLVIKTEKEEDLENIFSKYQGKEFSCNEIFFNSENDLCDINKINN